MMAPPLKAPLCVVELEDQARANLYGAVRVLNVSVGGEPDARGTSIAHVDIWQEAAGTSTEPGVRMVERIERFTAELERQTLPNLNVLEQTEVHLIEDWSP